MMGNPAEGLLRQGSARVKQLALNFATGISRVRITKTDPRGRGKVTEIRALRNEGPKAPAMTAKSGCLIKHDSG